MKSVEVGQFRPTTADTVVATTTSAVRGVIDGFDPPQAHRFPTIASAAPAAETPPPSLASLLDQARAAQAELAGQPLPITNHHHRFLMNLFGG